MKSQTLLSRGFPKGSFKPFAMKSQTLSIISAFPFSSLSVSPNFILNFLAQLQSQDFYISFFYNKNAKENEQKILYNNCN